MSQIPVLVVAFNRPEHLRKTLSKAHSVGIENLFVAVDGPRLENSSDRVNVNKCIDVIDKMKSNFSHVEVQVEEKNLGCKDGPKSALDWFFSLNNMGVVVEDDIEITKGFVDFCEYNLTRHDKNMDIWQINGWSPFQVNELVTGSWVSRYAFPWGWASWSNRWAMNNFTHNYNPTHKISEFMSLLDVDVSSPFITFWENAFENTLNGFDAWDYEWFHEIWTHGGFAISPPFPLVTNFGFGEDATHSKNASGRAAHRASLNFDKQKLYNFPLKNVELDQVLDKLVFGIPLSDSALSNSMRHFTPFGKKTIRKLLGQRFTLISLLHTIHLKFGRSRVVSLILKSKWFLRVSKVSFIDKLLSNYRKNVWFQ